MNKSITHATQNDKQISNSIKKFFTRFHVSSALKASNAYKKKGVPVMEIFQYLFLLIFSNRSMYMNLQMFRTMLSDNTETFRQKNQRIGECIYEYTSGYAENTAVSYIKSEH